MKLKLLPLAVFADDFICPKLAGLQTDGNDS